MGKPKYEIVIVNEAYELVRITYANRDRYSRILSAMKEKGVAVIRSGSIKE